MRVKGPLLWAWKRRLVSFVLCAGPGAEQHSAGLRIGQKEIRIHRASIASLLLPPTTAPDLGGLNNATNSAHLSYGQDSETSSSWFELQYFLNFFKGMTCLGKMGHLPSDVNVGWERVLAVCLIWGAGREWFPFFQAANGGFFKRDLDFPSPSLCPQSGSPEAEKGKN